MFDWLKQSKMRTQKTPAEFSEQIALYLQMVSPFGIDISNSLVRVVVQIHILGMVDMARHLGNFSSDQFVSLYNSTLRTFQIQTPMGSQDLIATFGRAAQQEEVIENLWRAAGMSFANFLAKGDVNEPTALLLALRTADENKELFRPLLELLEPISRSAKAKWINPTIASTKSVGQDLTSIDEERIWQQASQEFDANRNEGLWAKCYAECDGDENRAKAKYLSRRAHALLHSQVNSTEVGTETKGAAKKTATTSITPSVVNAATKAEEWNVNVGNERNGAVGDRESRSELSSSEPQLRAYKPKPRLKEKPSRPNAVCPLCGEGVLLEALNCWSCLTSFRYTIKPTPRQ